MNLIEKILLESNEFPNKYIIFCDMDGVLCDFVKGYYKLTGIDIDKSSYTHITNWSVVDSSNNFWYNLPWMSDGKKLWEYIKVFNPNILSSPSSSTTAITQKEAWIHKNLTDVKKIIFCQKEEKQNYAAPNHILIDDYKPTIIEWNSKGGIGIWHTSALNTISTLKKLGLFI